MKRFIDLGGQIYAGSDDDPMARRFAWYDTVVDRFEEHGGESQWATWDDFAEVHEPEQGELSRYRGLCPPWVFRAKRAP